jgi:hypothetical protein
MPWVGIRTGRKFAAPSLTDVWGDVSTPINECVSSIALWPKDCQFFSRAWGLRYAASNAPPTPLNGKTLAIPRGTKFALPAHLVIDSDRYLTVGALNKR